jgi:antitoxin Phd
MKNWQLQVAKARFSEVVRRAMQQGPQNITVRGESAVIVLSKVEYDRLKKPKLSLIDMLRQSPLFGANLHIDRDKSLPRDIDL